MPESYRLYLDEMFGLEIARALRDEGHDVLRTSETAKRERMTGGFWKRRLPITRDPDSLGMFWIYVRKIRQIRSIPIVELSGLQHSN